MDEKDLRSIIEQVLTEMNVSGAKPAEKAAAACACESAPEVEDGCIPDITEIDIRKQYLVKNPENGEEYAELKMNAPCRLGIGKAGARYNTLPQLEFRAAHSAAQDAVFNDVDAEFVEKMGLWTVQTQCDSKDTSDPPRSGPQAQPRGRGDHQGQVQEEPHRSDLRGGRPVLRRRGRQHRRSAARHPAGPGELQDRCGHPLLREVWPRGRHG